MRSSAEILIQAQRVVLHHIEVLSSLRMRRVAVGALNLLDKDPLLSLTTANFQIGYDARYYDPRGRVLFGKVEFRFWGERL